MPDEPKPELEPKNVSEYVRDQIKHAIKQLRETSNAGSKYTLRLVISVNELLTKIIEEMEPEEDRKERIKRNKSEAKAHERWRKKQALEEEEREKEAALQERFQAFLAKEKEEEEAKAKAKAEEEAKKAQATTDKKKRSVRK